MTPYYVNKSIKDQTPLNPVDVGNKEEHAMQCACYLLSHVLNYRFSCIRSRATSNGASKPPACNHNVIIMKFNNNNNNNKH